MSLKQARLSSANLSLAAPEAARPGYQRDSLRPGIVHLGIGAFHRAHQAVCTDAALAAKFDPWGIIGVSLRSPAVRDQLMPQDGLYAVLEKGARERVQVVGSVRLVLYAPDDIDRVLATIADPAIRIVSLTVTEKGYLRDPATGKLRDGDPDVQHDVDHPGTPRSTLGVLVRGIERRKRAQAGPLTVLCCDNLPGNGRAVAAVVEGFARRIDPALADWTQRNVAFPSTMVDRIVPATTEDDRRRAAALLGLEDAGTVVAEPFTQWVVEDRFAAGRPAWEAGGAQFVSDVAPFETMKLRLLNGSHTTMALLGFLAGHRFVREAAVDPPFRRLIERLMAEDSAPTLAMPPGADLAAYQRALVERFANPRLDHQLKQICMDSSQKLPQRLLMPARERLKAGAVPQHVALAVAGFMRYAAGWDEAGQPIQIDDPLAAKLRAAGAAGGKDAAMLARAMFAIGEVFGTDLPQNAAFVVAVQNWLAKLLAKGAKATVAEAYG